MILLADVSAIRFIETSSGTLLNASYYQTRRSQFDFTVRFLIKKT